MFFWCKNTSNVFLFLNQKILMLIFLVFIHTLFCVSFIFSTEENICELIRTDQLHLELIENLLSKIHITETFFLLCVSDYTEFRSQLLHFSMNNWKSFYSKFHLMGVQGKKNFCKKQINMRYITFNAYL